MKKLKINIFNLVIFFITFLGGIFFSRFLLNIENGKLNFKSETNFDLFELLSLLVSVALAIYITRNLTKKNESENRNSSLYIQYLSDFKTEYNNKISHLINNRIVDSSTINSTMKLLRRNFYVIKNIAIEKKIFEFNDLDMIEINNNLEYTKNELTNQPLNTLNEQEINLIYFNVEMKRIDIDKCILLLSTKIK